MVLAPVVRDRKGEFVELFEQMQAQGYVRFRVDGQTYDAVDVPKLKKAEKHDIDVVIDRVKVPAAGDAAAAAPLRQRLAESFEAALRIADGRALAVEMDAAAEHLYSSKFACPLCDYSLPELEPRLFSFNSPVGACPTCDGLGVTTVFDAERVVAFPSLSLASGAVKGWDRRNPYTFSLLESVADALRLRHRHAVRGAARRSARGAAARLGRGRDRVRLRGAGARGKQRSVKRKHPFEGILPNLERRFRETDSAAVREDLVRLQSAKPCPDCHGTRLRVEARNVFLVDVASDEKEPIYRVEHFTLREALAWFERLALAGTKAEIADKVIREICSRLKFLNDVGLNYLSLDRSAETLSGGEAQRIRLASQIGSGLTGVMYVLDEPSIGLHQRDNERLIGTLFHLRDIGNSVIVVEHDEEAIRAADHVIDMGPGAGVHGGRVMAEGRPEDVAAAPDSLTGRYLSHVLRIPVPQAPAAAGRGRLAAHRRRARQQPEDGRRRDPGRPLHLRHRRLGLGQVDAGQRHDLRRGRQASLSQPRRAGAARRHQRHRLLRQGDQRRPVADRPDAALEPGDLHRPLHADPRALRRSAGGARARLRARALLVQRRRRPVRGVPGRRRAQGRDALPARRLRAVRRLPRPALQPRDARDPLQGQEHHRGAEPDRGGRARLLQRRAEHRPEAADAARRRPRLHPPRPERDDALGRRGAARQARARALQARHRPHALHPRRADDRPALRRHRPAAEGAAHAARRRQHGGRHRAQPGRHQDRRLGRRHGARGRRRRRLEWSRRERRRRSPPAMRASPAAICGRSWRPERAAARGAGHGAH